MTSYLTIIFVLMATPSKSSDIDTRIDPIIDIAVTNCKNVPEARRAAAREIAIKLFKIEETFNVPNSLKGMVLAAACAESGFNPIALGDRKFSRDRKTPKAVGILQLWPWWERGRWGYKIDRRKPEQSARAWMTHISRQIPSIKRKCKPKSKKLMWIQAWVQAIRAPKSSGRCKERPKHLRYLRKFHRILKKRNARFSRAQNMKNHNSNIKQTR